VDALIDAVNGGQVPAAAPPRRAGRDGGDEITRGVRDGKIAAGMTLEQVQQVTGDRGKLDSEAYGVKTYKWYIRAKQVIRDGGDVPQNGYILVVDFEDGKVAAFHADRAYGGAVTAPSGSAGLRSPGR
jgi:hypothetical protein